MRILHTMLRVGDLPRSVDFYTRVMGMQLLRTTDRPEQKYRLAFVGYGDESAGAVLELTYNYDVPSYDLGSGFGHVAIEVDDAAATCAAVRAAVGAGAVTREAGPVKGGTTVIAFAVKAVLGLRPSEDVELGGLDLAEHGEEGYHGEGFASTRSFVTSDERVTTPVGVGMGNRKPVAT